MTHARLIALVVLCLLTTQAARADGDHPDDLLSQARFDQRLDAQVAPDLTFRDSRGEAVRLGDYFGAKPTLLAPVYFNCPNLCDVVLHDLIARLRAIPFDVGNEFNLVIVSIDPREQPALAASKQQDYVTEYGRPATAAGWHLLTGEPAMIQRLADDIGMHYAYDAQTDQYAHPSGLILLTPQGRISRYFYGLEYSPTDLRLGLVEASAGRIGSPLDQVLLRCYHYDPVTGRYSFAIISLLQLAGVATTLALGSYLIVLVRRERRLVV